jgi:hypothetical protein
VGGLLAAEEDWLSGVGEFCKVLFDPQLKGAQRKGKEQLRESDTGLPKFSRYLKVAFCASFTKSWFLIFLWYYSSSRTNVGSV